MPTKADSGGEMESTQAELGPMDGEEKAKYGDII
jgi:hypothetical protein